jgi:NO-binding membrane sensor protein with MHYT domain
VLAANNFTYGLLTPVLGYFMSCIGAFIGLRCTTRAYAYQGAARARWLALAAVSIGTTGVWVMHFIAMLGYTIPGMTIRYNVPVTIGSMLIAVIVVFVGLLIVGFGRPTWRNLLIAGLITGIGVASMHYTGMAAMEMRATMSYTPALFALSIVIGIVAATAALWAALRLRGVWSTLGASLIMGVAVSGMHYTGMAAMQVRRAADSTMAMNGPTAESFLLPLILGIGVVAIVMTAILVFAPTDAEIREDAELMARINAATARLNGTPPPAAAPGPSTQGGPAARWRGPAAAGSAGQNGAPAQNGSAWQNGAAEAGPAGPAGPGAEGSNGLHRRGRRAGSADPDKR